MSCLEVMYQSYGAHYIPASQVAAAAAYQAACYRQQQKRPSVYSKMQEFVEQQQQCPGSGQQHQGGILPREQDHQRSSGTPGTGSSSGSTSDLSSKESSQPAEAEYLSSRCVLFTYFQGDIGDVVDEHFSRALSQPNIFSRETKSIRVTQSPASVSSGLWKDGVSPSEGQCSSLSSSPWNNAYPSQATPHLPSVSVSICPDFSSSPVPFHSPDRALWAGHTISHASLQPTGPFPDTWTHTLNPQSTGGYTHIHDVYSHPPTHIHGRNHHTVIQSYPAHSPTLDPRFGSLLLPGVRNHSSPVLSPGSHSQGKKAPIHPNTSSTAWPTSASDIYDSGITSL